MPRVLSIFTSGREVILTEMAQVDQTIAALSALPDSKNHPSIALLNQGRDRLQVQLKIVDRAIADTKAAIDGRLTELTDPASPPADRPVIAGQYANAKLTAATQSFLMERGGGPMPAMTILKRLIAGGCKIIQTRTKDSKKLGLPRDPDHRDLLRMVNSNRPRYVYDVNNDTIGLRMGGTGGMTAWKVSKRDKAAELRRS